MVARLCLLGLLAGCYAAHTAPGAPCTPALGNCPESQSCALVGGSYVCVEGTVADAGTDGPAPDAPHTPLPVDARADAAATPQWSLVQSVGTTMPSLTMAASGAGNLIVVAVETNAVGSVTSVTDNAANTYVAIPTVRATDTADSLGLELWYAKNSLPGATTVTASAPAVNATVVWEVSGIRTTNPLDTATKLDDRPATTTPVGAAITTSVDGEFVVSVAIVANSVAGIHAGNEFTNDHRTNANGWAHLTDPAAPAGSHQAKWDQGTPGGYCASSAAFLVGP